LLSNAAPDPGRVLNPARRLDVLSVPFARPLSTGASRPTVGRRPALRGESLMYRDGLAPPTLSADDPLTRRTPYPSAPDQSGCPQLPDPATSSTNKKGEIIVSVQTQLRSKTEIVSPVRRDACRHLHGSSLRHDVDGLAAHARDDGRTEGVESDRLRHRIDDALDDGRGLRPRPCRPPLCRRPVLRRCCCRFRGAVRRGARCDGGVHDAGDVDDDASARARDPRPGATQ
jgi:hypothetical protein